MNTRISSMLIALGLLSSISVAEAIVIDNGIPIGTEGHLSVDMLTGGGIRSMVSTTKRYNSTELVDVNVVSSYRVFVDPGIDGQGFELLESEPVRTDTFNSGSFVSSEGTFVGTNGNTINWTAVSRAISQNFQGEPFLTTTYSFIVDFNVDTTIQPIGPIRVFFLLDGIDNQHVGNDVFSFRNTSSGNMSTLTTFDGVELFGVSHFGSRFAGESSRFAGWAVDSFDRIRERIVGSGQPVSTTGVINLPSFQHPQLGVVYGPANVVSVAAQDINPESSGVLMDTDIFFKRPPPPSSTRPSPDDDECFPEDGDCEGPIVPVSRKFSCQGTKCKVEIACNQTTECNSNVKIFVTPVVNRTSAPPFQRPIRFASAITNIPPGAVALVKPKLTKRGRAFFRVNRNKRVRGVMEIANSATGDVVTSVQVRIKLK